MAASSAVRREVRWRVTGTSAWSDIASCSPVAELTLEGLDRTKTYDVEVRDISACGAKSAWVLHSAVIPDVAPGNITLSDLYADAAAAQADATNSLNQLADIAADGMLTADEKVEAKQRYNTLTAEQTGIDAQATSYGITTEKTNYDGAITALKNYLKTTVGVLDASFVWTGITGTTAITRATWDSTWTTAYTAKTTLLNAIYAAAKAVADAAQATANTATGQVSQLPVINGGFDVPPTGYGWTADSGTGWFVDTTGVTPGVGPNCARHTGGVGSATGAYRNNGLAPCGPGQVYKAQALIKAVGANGVGYVMISWCDAGGGEIGTTTGNFVTGTTTAGSYAAGQAPPGTVYARTCLAVSGHTAGYYALDNVVCTQYPSSMDEVPDGTTYYKQTSTGRGVNIMPADWSLFLGPAPPASGNAPNLTLGQDTTAANLLGVAKNLRVTTGATAPTVLYFARSGQFITIKPNSKWIVQMGCRCSISGMQAEIQMVNASATPLGRTGIFTMPNWAAAVVSGVLDASAFADTSAQLRLVFSGTWPSGTAFFISFIGLEEQNGASTTPSAFSPPVARTLDEQADGATYGRPLNNRLNAGRPLIDFSEGIHPNKNIDNIGDGTTYARINGSELSSGVHKLGVAGSGYRLGDLRNQIMAGVGNYGAGWSGGSVTYSASSTSATITAAAASLQIDETALAYNASNVTVSGTAGTTRLYYLYYDDPGYTGGSKTLNATTSQITSLAGKGRLLVGTVSVTFPTSGTGSGGGGTGCPQVDEPVIRRAQDGSEEVIRAGDVRDDDYLLLSSGRWGRVTYSEAKPQPGVCVEGADGSSITCSASAPLETADGPCVPAPYVSGLLLRHRTAGVMRAVNVTDTGDIWVQHITCENDCFWVANFSHHNMKP